MSPNSSDQLGNYHGTNSLLFDGQSSRVRKTGPGWAPTLCLSQDKPCATTDACVASHHTHPGIKKRLGVFERDDQCILFFTI